MWAFENKLKFIRESNFVSFSCAAVRFLCRPKSKHERAPLAEEHDVDSLIDHGTAQLKCWLFVSERVHRPHRVNAFKEYIVVGVRRASFANGVLSSAIQHLSSRSARFHYRALHFNCLSPLFTARHCPISMHNLRAMRIHQYFQFTFFVSIYLAACGDSEFSRNDIRLSEREKMITIKCPPKWMGKLSATIFFAN